MYKIIKTDYNYDFHYMLPNDIINYNPRYIEPQKLIDNINNKKIPNLIAIGFSIENENEYKATKTKILINFNGIYYTPIYHNVISAGFTGRVECNNDNIYYYLYSKRPISTNHLKIIEVPDKKKIKAKDYIKVRCLKDGYEYNVTLNKFLQNKKCPKCTNQIAYDMYNLTKFVYMKRPPEYTDIFITYVPFIINGKDDYLYLKCSSCETEWNTTTITSYVNNGTGCPYCKISKGENNKRIIIA